MGVSDSFGLKESLLLEVFFFSLLGRRLIESEVISLAGVEGVFGVNCKGILKGKILICHRIFLVLIRLNSHYLQPQFFVDGMVVGEAEFVV